MDWRLVLEQSTLTPTDLRRAFRGALEASQRYASITDSPDDPHVLEVRTRTGTDGKVDLHRLYHELVRMEPGERARHFEDHLTSSLEAAQVIGGELPTPTRDQLVPTIKSVAWVAGLPMHDVATTPLVADIAIVYAWDRPHTLSFATLAELQHLGISLADARELAVDNLRARMPHELPTRGDGRSFLFAAGGNIEASLLLVPELWETLAAQLEGDIVGCAAARDVLLVSATGIAGGIESLLAARARIVEALTASELISTTLLVRRAAAWHVFERN